MPLARPYSAYSSRHGRTAWAALAASAALTMMTSISFAASTPPIDPSGYWSTKDDESIIRIGLCGTPATTAATPTPSTPPIYCGTLVWLKDPLEKGVPKVDDLNPDPAKRGRPIIGMDLFTEFVADGDHWKGKAYNSDDGKTWDVTFKVLPDKVKGDKIEITGCLVWPLCQSEHFTKVQTVPGGDPTLAAANTSPHGTPGKAAPSASPATPHH
jgi:uncharacterized protein (DUF2147 family)